MSTECLPCAMTASSETHRWSGVLGMEGQMTGDGRYIERNALYWEDLPLPIRYVAADVGAHDGAQVVGRITNIWRGENGKIMGEGDFDPDSPHGKEATRQVAENLTNGVSMDLDDVSFEVRMSSELVSLMEAEGVAPDEEALADDEGRIKVAAVNSDDEVRITTAGRIRAATIVAIPAFAEAKIALAASAETFGYDPGQARVPKGQKDGGQWMDTPGGTSADLQSKIAALKDSGVAPKVPQLRSVWEWSGNELNQAFNGEGRYAEDGAPLDPNDVFNIAWGDEAIVDWLVQAKSGRFIVFEENYQAVIDEAGRRGLDVSQHEFAAQKQTFAEKQTPSVPLTSEQAFQIGVNELVRCGQFDFASEDYLECAQNAAAAFSEVTEGELVELAQDAAAALEKFLAVNWTDLSVDDLKESEGEEPNLAEPGMDEAITASGASRPPLTWFRDPQLTEPTPLTVTDDGRVYGHLASWGTCHIGHSHNGTCVTPPRSKTRYAHFRVGSVMTAEGKEVATGRITLETRHAKGTLNPTQTLAHYEDTGRVVADVAAGEDRHGIWIAGCIRPGTPDDKIAALRGSPLSGDWRRIGGNLELVAALAVNVPGFPIPRPAGLVASGRLQSLVASGMVAPKKVAAPGTPDALSTDDLRYLKRLAARERRNEAESMKLRVAKADLAMRRKTFSLSTG